VKTTHLGLGSFHLYAFLVACGPTQTPVERPDTDTVEQVEGELPLHGELGREDFADNQGLLQRLRGSLYGYFRFTNARFADAVCARFEGDLEDMPTVNLHGDAHVEQYAITTNGRGLADYDDSASGPGVLDLVRFGTSVKLAAELREWDPEPVVDAFLESYAASLADPEAEGEAPAFVSRIAGGFEDDREAYVAWVASMMEEPAPEESALFERIYGRYRDLMQRQHPELPETFFEVRTYGRLRLGFGSALAVKFLVLAEGETDSPLDDVVLEAKQLSSLDEIRCLRTGASGGAFRVLIGQARVSGRPRPYIAHVPPSPEHPDDPPFWVHSWLDHYHEVDLAEDLGSPEELIALAREVGIQLGRGHTRQIAAPFDFQLRDAQRRTLEHQEAAVREAIDAMAQRTRDDWARFRAQTEP